MEWKVFYWSLQQQSLGREYFLSAPLVLLHNYIQFQFSDQAQQVSRKTMVEFDMIQICLTDDDSDENSDTEYDKEGDSLNIFALVARG